MSVAELILLEDVYKLGTTGDVVTVKPGYARNYLIPKGKALIANDANISIYNSRKSELEKLALQKKKDAEAMSNKMSGKVFTVLEQASEKGMLYGAVTSVSMSRFLDEKGYKVAKDAVQIRKPIKSVGIYEVEVVLHANVVSSIRLNISVSDEQAQIQLEEEKEELESNNDGDNLN